MNLRYRWKGNVLLLTIFFMALLQLLAVAFVRLLPVESQAAIRNQRSNTASLVAEAGIADALGWLRAQLAPPGGGAAKEPMQSDVYPSEAYRTVSINPEWKFRWWLEPDSQTFPNGGNPLRAYTVHARAYQSGGGSQYFAQKEAVAEVIQDSLAGYARLYDEWPSNLVQAVRTTTAPKGGPVHVNDLMRLWIPEGNTFWNSAGAAVYSHGLTASGTYTGGGTNGDGFAYYEGNWSGSNGAKIPYNGSGPIASRYNRLVAGGRQNIKAGVGNVNLPTNTFNLREAAWGFSNSNPLPSSNGVYVNKDSSGKVAGGIYIRGTVEEMELGYGGSQPAGATPVLYGSNSWVKVEQPGAGKNSIDTHKAVTVVSVAEPIVIPTGANLNGTVVTVPQTIPANSTLIRQTDGKFTSIPGDLNGVVYSNSDINNVWGVNKGRRTITAEMDATTDVKRQIRIGGKENDSNGKVSVAAGEKGLVQFGVTDADGNGILDAPTNAENTLGLVGYNVRVASEMKKDGLWNSQTETNPLYIYATVMAGLPGEGGTYSVEGYDSGGAGYVYTYGSQVVVQAGAWGTTSGHGLVNGTGFFDEPAANYPPPYFPSSPTFSLKTYQEMVIVDGSSI